MSNKQNDDDIKHIAYDILCQFTQSSKNPLTNKVNTKIENQNFFRNTFLQNIQKGSPHKQNSVRQKQIANQSQLDEYNSNNMDYSLTIQNPELQLVKFRTSLNKMKDCQIFHQTNPLKKSKLYGVSTRWRYEKSLSKNKQTLYDHKISETLSQFSKNFIINYPNDKDQSANKQNEHQDKAQLMQQECLKILQIPQVSKQLPKVVDFQASLSEEVSGCFLKPRSAKMLNRIQSIRTERRFFDSNVPTPPENVTQIIQQSETISSKDFFQYAFPNTSPIRKIPFSQNKQRLLKTESDQDEQISSQSISQRSNPRRTKDNFFKFTFGSSQNQPNLSTTSQHSKCVFKNFVQPKEIQAKPTRQPLISAKSFILMNADTGTIYKSRKQNQQRQVASLTKIATCFTALKIIQELDLEEKELFFKVPRIASRIKGTSANLKFSNKQIINHIYLEDIISLSDSLFGMMLPSGNDAATLISEALGYMLFLRKFNKDHLIKSDRVIDLDFESEQNQEILKNENQNQEGKNSEESLLEIKPYTDTSQNTLFSNEKYLGFSHYFIQHMNSWAQKLDMKRTYFVTPHGLANKNNLSCAVDIAKLSIESMKLPKFKSIVSCREHICITKRPMLNNQFKEIQYRWFNTNKLLEKGFNGIKTGITDIAGPCLAASISLETHDGPKNLIIVVICSQTQDQRFEDVQKISNWAKKYIFESSK